MSRGELQAMKKATGKRRKMRPRSGAHYALAILDWRVDYSFSLDKDRRITPGPYWEHTSLKIQGRFIEPAILLNRTVEMIIMGDRRETFAVQQPEEVQWNPIAIGDFTINKNEAEYLGSLSFDVLHLIVSLLAAGKIRFLVLTGEELYRSRANIFSFHFENEYDPEMWC